MCAHPGPGSCVSACGWFISKGNFTGSVVWDRKPFSLSAPAVLMEPDSSGKQDLCFTTCLTFLCRVAGREGAASPSAFGPGMFLSWKGATGGRIPKQLGREGHCGVTGPPRARGTRGQRRLKEGDSGASSEASSGTQTSVSALGVGGCSRGWEWQRFNFVFRSAREGKAGGLRYVTWDLGGL